MPEIYTKDKNGNLQNLGNIDISNLRANINSDELNSCVKEFWSDKKSGKHPELAKVHHDILTNTLLVKPTELFDQLNNNKFNFSNFGPLNLHTFLKDAKLDSYLKPEYVSKCLNVHTNQPDIGKGEFLLVACFNNINFNSESGDLVDDDGNKIEVKGNHSSLGGSGKLYKQMNKDIMFSIYRLFNTNPDYNDFTMDCSKQLQQMLLDNPKNIKPTMLYLQNNAQKSETLADDMVNLFNEKQNLLQVIAAAHLYSYLHLQKANFLFAINDKKFIFSGIETPKTIKQAYEILNGFTINGWTTGNTGITISLNKDKK